MPLGEALCLAAEIAVGLLHRELHGLSGDKAANQLSQISFLATIAVVQNALS